MTTQNLTPKQPASHEVEQIATFANQTAQIVSEILVAESQHQKDLEVHESLVSAALKALEMLDSEARKIVISASLCRVAQWRRL